MKLVKPQNGLLPMPIYRPVHGQQAVELVEDFHFQNFTIPAGTICNGQTIPAVFWPIVGSLFEPLSFPASVVHDDLYWTGKATFEGKEYPVTRARADATFYDMCLLYGGDSKIIRVRAYLKYIGLRLGGWRVWNRYRRENK